MHGSGQEYGLRPGTNSPMLCAGFGAAAEVAMTQRESGMAHVEQLWRAALESFAGWTVNGSLDARYPGNLNIRRDGVDAARLISDLRNIAVSLGSACGRGTGKPSHVLRAIGLSDAEARSSVRIGFGRYTEVEEIERAAGAINEAAQMQKVAA
jgi:cysteine desulfurase